MNQIRWIAFSSHDTWSQINLFQLCSGATATFIGAACEHLRRSIDFCKRNKNDWHLCEELVLLVCHPFQLGLWCYPWYWGLYHALSISWYHDIMMISRRHPWGVGTTASVRWVGPGPGGFCKGPAMMGSPVTSHFPFSMFFFVSVFCGKIWDCARLFLAPDIVAAWLMLPKCFGALFDVFFSWFLGICDVSFRSTDVLNLDFAAFQRDYSSIINFYQLFYLLEEIADTLTGLGAAHHVCSPRSRRPAVLTIHCSNFCYSSDDDDDDDDDHHHHLHHHHHHHHIQDASYCAHTLYTFIIDCIYILSCMDSSASCLLCQHIDPWSGPESLAHLPTPTPAVSSGKSLEDLGVSGRRAPKHLLCLMERVISMAIVNPKFIGFKLDYTPSNSQYLKLHPYISLLACTYLTLPFLVPIFSNSWHLKFSGSAFDLHAQLEGRAAVSKFWGFPDMKDGKGWKRDVHLAKIW